MTNDHVIAVCSWSLGVNSITELEASCNELGIHHVQLACGDPNHVAWEEGDGMPEAAKASELSLVSSMIGFAGEDYSSPQSIKATGGFGDPAQRDERLKTLNWALDRSVALGVDTISCHAGFIPAPEEEGRHAFLDSLSLAGSAAAERGLTLAFETGQETAQRLKQTLDELQVSNLKVNFDPANMLLYDMGDPIEAVEILGDYIVSVHCKDAHPPKTKDDWGKEMPLGQGSVDIERFIKTLLDRGYQGPFIIERESGSDRMGDIARGAELIRHCLNT